MCIVVIKNKGVDLPEYDVLKNCFQNNPDGSGFVINRSNKNYIYKGFFTFNGFYNAFQSMNPSKNDIIIFHFRIATHGKVNAYNCHPFPIQKNFKNMKKTFYITDSNVLIHNGKLDIQIKNNKYSDSMHFAKKLYGFDYKKNKNIIEFLIRPTQYNLKGNRIVIMNNYGNIEKFGTGWIQKNGIFYSNNSFNKKTKNKFKSISSYGILNTNCSFIKLK